MLNKVIDLIARVSLGKELALALLLLRLIAEALQKKNVSNIAVFVYRHLPRQWRAPNGPATEGEFVEMVESGQSFLLKVRAVISK